MGSVIYQSMLMKVSFFTVRHRREREELDRKHEKDLLNLRKKLELRNAKPRSASNPQQPGSNNIPGQHGYNQLPRQRSNEESHESLKANGFQMEHHNTQPRKSFKNTDKEIEQLAQFESKTKKKIDSRNEKKPATGHAEKMSLNQIKESQQQNYKGSITGTMKKGPTPPPQTQAQLTTTTSYSGSRNPSYGNIAQIPGQNPANTNFPVWGGTAPAQDIKQWQGNMEPRWTQDNQAWLPSTTAVQQGAFVPITTQGFVPVATLSNQPFQNHKTPHR